MGKWWGGVFAFSDLRTPWANDMFFAAEKRSEHPLPKMCAKTQTPGSTGCFACQMAFAQVNRKQTAFTRYCYLVAQPELDEKVLTIRGADLSARLANVSVRKEVIQPQVLLRLPCYDFVPVTDTAVGTTVVWRLRALPAPMT